MQAKRNRQSSCKQWLVILADLKLSIHQPLGYCFDFDTDRYHFISLEKIEMAIPAVAYPRLRRRIENSPPQFDPEIYSEQHPVRSSSHGFDEAKAPKDS